MKDYPERKRNRLKNYDYSQNGRYFVTICVKNRMEFFGKIINGKMILNIYGRIVQQSWLDLPNHYKNCHLGQFIVMPNHIHGIVVIKNDIFPVGNGSKPFPTMVKRKHGLSEITRGFKTFSSRKINEQNNIMPFAWQKSFYDHIIRSNEDLNRIRAYIFNNPRNWNLDRNNRTI